MTDLTTLQEIITKNWSNLSEINDKTANQELKDTVKTIISLINKGSIRVAEKINNKWVTNQWVKQAILLHFKLNNMRQINYNNEQINTGYWWDKIDIKFADWTEQDFSNSGIRAVPGSIVRHGSYIGKQVVLMPCFVNIGAYIDSNTMIDTWASVGSCAQIGKNVHISGGAGIGGVLEPLQANPVVIEDNCFIGARSEIAEGIIVQEGSVISMGVYISASTKIVNRTTGEIFYGTIPPYSVVVPGTIKNENDHTNLYCAVIVKQVDAQTRSKTSINDILRY